MVRKRLLLLLMMTATGVVTESPTRVTDGELAKVVVETTSKFLEGPTGRQLSIQDRFQGWMNSLEHQISEFTYNAVNRATTAISRIPFFETYFSQYQSPLSTLQREPPKQQPVLYIYPQSKQYLYHEDDQPSAHDAIGQNILNPDTVDDYQDNEDETSYDPQEISSNLPPHSKPPYLQAPERDRESSRREHYLKLLDSGPPAQGHYPHKQKQFLQAQDQKLQTQDEYLVAEQKLQNSIELQYFSPKYQSPAVKENVLSSDQQRPYVPLPPFIPRPPQVKSDVASPSQELANGQVSKGLVNEAIRRVSTEEGGGISSVQRPASPNVAGDGSYRDGPYYPDAVQGGFTLAPAALYTVPKSPLPSDKGGIPSTKPSFTQNLQKFTPDQYSPPLSANNGVPSSGLSKRRRSAGENFSIWNLFTDNTTPTALYCPSGGVKLLMCAGDQLFDAYVKAPIDRAKDWVSNIDLHLYEH